MDSFINYLKDLGLIFTNPSWQLILIFFYLIIASTILILMNLLKKKKIILVSFGVGTIGGIILFFLTSNNNIDQEQVKSMVLWLSLSTDIFLVLVMLVVPFYLFTTVSTTLSNTRHYNKPRGMILISFFSLLFVTFLGILIALFLIPLIKIININISLGGAMMPSPSFFGKFIIFIIISAIIFSIILNLLHKYKHGIGEPLITELTKFRIMFINFYKKIAMLIPFVIIHRLPLLFNNYNDQFVEVSTSLFSFIMLFFLGLFIVYIVEATLVYFLAKNKKHFFKRLKRFMGESIYFHSAPMLLPKTQNILNEFEVDKNIVETTPILGTFMGFSVCGGFYPALIVLVTLANDSAQSDTILWVFIFFMIFTILTSTLGMTGVPGADVAIIISILTTLGLSTLYFQTIYLIDGILDKFRGIGNSLGFVLATLITSKFFIKQTNKEKEKID